ncbi:MAG TPA: AAA family ATPase [Candidatus Limnocylindrales bacterium]|jgi:DNA-binding CsgD family transcriptional regulator
MDTDLIGRATEVEAVDRFLERARSALAGLLIHGDAGIGKTAIWRAAIEHANEVGARVLRSAPAESERTLSLGGLTDLLSTVTDAELAFLPAVQRHALGIAILRTEPSGQLPDQRTLSVATATLLRELASDRPLILAIDDAQWLDEASAAIVAYAIRRLVDRHAGVLLAVRGEPATSVLELVAGVPDARREQLRVGPLPLAALHQLFLARSGRSFPRLVLVRIEEASGGNPFYALEIARDLVRSGAVVTPGERLPIPETLGALVEARIGALPPATRGALLLAAVAAEPTIDTLRRADPEAPAALGPALEASIVGVDRQAIRFSHPLLAQAVISLARPDELRRVHATLARTATSDDARARHLGGATEGRDESVAQALEAAAVASRDRGATLDAASLYERASELTPELRGEEAIRRAMLAAECLFIDVSEVVQADAMLETAIAVAPPGPARADALSLRAVIRYYHGQTPDAVRLGDAALAEAGNEPLLRAKVLGRAAFLVMQIDLERGNRLVTEALELLDGADAPANVEEVDPDLLANVLLLHASSEFGLVRGLRTDEIERGRGLISDTGRSWEHDGADGIDYGFARQLDDVDRAIAMTEHLIQVKSGPGGDDPFNLVSLSGLQLFRGDWPAARRSAEAANEGYGREGADIFPSWRLRGLALVAAHDGRTDEARRLATEGLELALASGDLALEVYHRHILGFVALSTGDVHEADAQLTAAERAATASGTRHPGRFKIDGDRLEAALAVGDIERATAIVDWLEHAGRVAPTPWTLAIADRGRGLLQAARGDGDAALDSLTRALVAHERLPMPFERARTLLALGQVHRRRKEKRLADERLREALAIFETLGAPLWADRATVELARIGLRPRAAHDLTETERRVAELAATGMTSRQIAERAFLAPKTVGNVLGRVYEKLGIHSRAELGARMGEGPDEGTERDRSG